MIMKSLIKMEIMSDYFTVDAYYILGWVWMWGHSKIRGRRIGNFASKRPATLSFWTFDSDPPSRLVRDMWTEDRCVERSFVLMSFSRASTTSFINKRNLPWIFLSRCVWLSYLLLRVLAETMVNSLLKRGCFGSWEENQRSDVWFVLWIPGKVTHSWENWYIT